MIYAFFVSVFVYRQSGTGRSDTMKRMIGFILFWIAVGMLIMLFIHNILIGFIIIGLLLLIGYNLFC